MIITATKSPAMISMMGEIYSDDCAVLGAHLEELRDAGDLTLRLSSGGGEYYAARRMLTMLDDVESLRIECYGQVASAATLFLCAKNAKVYAETGCSFLVHGASVENLSANKEGLESAAAELEQVNKNLLSIYARRVAGSGVENMLLQDTLFGAEEALSLGLIDGILDDVKISAKSCRMVAVSRLTRIQKEVVQMADSEIKKKELQEEEEDKKIENGIKARFRALAPRFKASPAAHAVYSLYERGYIPATEAVMTILEGYLEAAGVPGEDIEEIAEDAADDIVEEIADEEEEGAPLHITARKRRSKPVARASSLGPDFTWKGWRK